MYVCEGGATRRGEQSHLTADFVSHSTTCYCCKDKLAIG